MGFGDWDIFHELMRGGPRSPRREAGRGPAPADYTWCPAVDVYEREDSLVLLVDLPGVLKEDIDLRLEADVLTLTGHRRRQERAGVRLERPVGRFARSFRIRVPVTPEGAHATYREGVLEVVLHKSAQPGPERVRVTVE